MKYIFLLMSMIPFPTWSASLTNVEVMEVLNEESGGYQFKMRANDLYPNTFFVLTFSQDNKDHLSKLNHILLKLSRGSGYRLDLVIPGFSPYPPGSIYDVTDVRFLSSNPRAPNQISQKKEQIPKSK